jgi:ADP-ribosylglycohydrolase
MSNKQVIFQDSKTPSSFEEYLDLCQKIDPDTSVVDKFSGAIIGLLIGNCFGYQAKRWTKSDLEVKKITSMYSGKIRDLKGTQWPEAGDQVVILARNLIKYKLKINKQALAISYLAWQRYGIPEIGKDKSYGISTHMSNLLQPNYQTKYLDCSKKLAFSFSHIDNPPPNCCLVRAAVCAITPNWVENVLSTTYMTHYSSYCAYASWFFVSIIRELLNEKIPDISEYVETKNKFFKQIEIGPLSAYLSLYTDLLTKITKYMNDDNDSDYDKCVVVDCDSKSDTKSDKKTETFAMFNDYLTKLELDNLGLHTHVMKALGCAIYALAVIKLENKHFSDEDFKFYMCKLISYGGDTDVNCAVAGCIFGCYLGWKKLPRDWRTHLQSENYAEWLITKLLQTTTLSD